MQIPALHEYLLEGGQASIVVILLTLYRKISIMAYQHKLIWTEFAKEHKINPNGKA